VPPRAVHAATKSFARLGPSANSTANHSAAPLDGRPTRRSPWIAANGSSAVIRTGSGSHRILAGSPPIVNESPDARGARFDFPGKNNRRSRSPTSSSPASKSTLPRSQAAPSGHSRPVLTRAAKSAVANDFPSPGAPANNVIRPAGMRRGHNHDTSRGSTSPMHRITGVLTPHRLAAARRSTRAGRPPNTGRDGRTARAEARVPWRTSSPTICASTPRATLPHHAGSPAASHTSHSSNSTASDHKACRSSSSGFSNKTCTMTLIFHSSTIATTRAPTRSPCKAGPSSPSSFRRR